MDIDISKYTDLIISFLITNGVKLLVAIVVLLFGLWVIKAINKVVRRRMEKKSFDPTLQPFIRSLISNLLKVLLVITVMSMVGIEMTSFIAILGAAGLAVGLALSGTLQNFAGGVMILILKPFKVGDLIETSGYRGVVKEILIFNTVLTTVDNKRVILPNGGLSTNSLINFNAESTRRVDFTFGISYNDDVEKAKKIINDIVSADDRILKDPLPFVRMGELADSSVNIITRVWVDTPEYWNVHFDILEKVYAAFNANNVSIPYPQMDVHVSGNQAN
ncbi:MAG: mechanosensitive ion channel [Vicingaceae bacterium]